MAVGVADASSNETAALIGASVKRFGRIVELRFALSGVLRRPALSAHGSQLWIDLGSTRIDLPQQPLAGREASPVDSVRIMAAGDGTARLVIEVDQRCDYAIARTADGLLVRLTPGGSIPNLVSPAMNRSDDTRPASAAYRSLPHQTTSRALSPHADTELAALHPPALPIPETVQPEERSPVAARPIVMIDPGHGGFDPGTEVGAPVLEKTVALQISLRLARALAARGIDARLTRDQDYFVTLPDRTRLANLAGADLFVSIHLNSSSDPNTAGIETYYLNNTTDRATIRLARMENAAGDANYGASTAVDLNYILSDLRQSYKAAESASLAGMIEAQTVAELESNLGIRVNELGAKQGPFYVLVGARMPAVLVECGFLSNRAETSNLVDERYQQVLADAIARAVMQYFNSDAAAGNL
ncbi:MAG TPA: N-acetylmuramoyl-L-alanine amidase [Candidatus Binataceae bacterium]|nr:N-acetylmuramoyl-L-alanine amidase [Candidatus Binataceae bacterium]